jgi:NADPH:quinone reductase-like Zn-dependent oxidoreductase
VPTLLGHEPAGTVVELGAGVGDVEVGDRVAPCVTKVAKLLGISRALAYELVARGELPASV